MSTTAGQDQTFTCPASLKAGLERYAALHSKTYGEEVDALTLIPHMLEAFMARDRVFKRTNKPALSAAPQTTDPR